MPNSTVTVPVSAGINGAELSFSQIGNQQITAIVDDTLNIDETNEDNNTFIRTISVGNPDFIVTDITPVVAYVGETFNFKVKIKNQGIVANLPTEQIRVGMKIDGGDIVYWSDYYSTPVDPNAIVQLIINDGLSVPDIVYNDIGTHQIVAIVDYMNIIDEINEDNNTLEKTLTIGKADLVVTDITPVNAYPGENVSFKIKVKNQGTVYTPSGIGRRIGLKINDSDTILWTSVNSSSIPAGITVEETITDGVNGSGLYNFEQPGTYNITAIVDDTFTIDELDEANNSLTKELVVQEPADLIVTDIIPAPINAAAGEPVKFSAVIKNIGTGSTISGKLLKVAFKIDGSDIICRTDAFSTAIAPGESIQVSVNSFNWQAIEGSHVITAVVDDESLLVETNEENNSFDKIIRIEKPCDLIVTHILLTPENPIPGEPVTFKAKIKNIGEGASPAGRNHRVGFKVDNSNVIIWADKFDWTITSGDSIIVSATWGSDASTWDAVVGTHTVTAIVDDISMIYESNEANNTLTKEITINKNRMFDPNEDYDSDGLSNSQELDYGTDLTSPDSDNDGIDDYDEINGTFGFVTDPRNPDSDGDGLYDNTEIKTDADPTTYGENLPVIIETNTSSQSVTIAVYGDGNLAVAPFHAEESDNMLLTTLDGIVGKPVDISIGGYNMDYAKVCFKYDESMLNGLSEDDLTIYWVDTEDKTLVELPSDMVEIDNANKTITGTVYHFSTYLVGSKEMMVDLSNVDIVFTIDQSGSMSSSDPNFYRLRAVKRFVQDIDKLKNRIGIVEFADYATIKQGLTNDIDLLNNVLANMRYTLNMTNIGDGLIKSGNVFGSTNPNTKTIVLLSDGYNNQGYSDNEVIEIARELNIEKGIMVNTVALGQGADTDLLQAIAGAGDGGYYYINNESGMTQEQVDAQIELLYIKLLKQLTLQKSIYESFMPSAKMALTFNSRYLGTDYKPAANMMTNAKTNYASGNFIEQVDDIKINSEGPEFILKRTYNSMAVNEDTLIGNGWRLNYESSIKSVPGYGEVIASALNLRSQPYGKVIAVLGRGCEFTLLDSSHDEVGGITWIHVKVADKTGYIAEKYTKMVGDGGVEVTYGSGTKITFVTDSQNGGYLSPYGVYDSLSMSSGNYVITRKDQTRYIYNSSGKLSAIEDKNGNRLSIVYNGERIDNISDEAGRSLSFSYPDNYNIEITAPNGYTTVYTLDSNGNLASVTDLRGKTTTYAYYDSIKGNRLKQIFDSDNNQVLRNDYDVFGRVVRQYDANDCIKYHIYKDVYQDEKTGEIIGDDDLVNYYINERGFMSKIKYNLIEHKVIEEADAEGVTTTHKYYVDYNGHMEDITNLEETDAFYKDHWKDIENNNWKTKEEIIDRSRNTTIYEKDENDNVTKITNPDLSVKNFEYDSKNNLIEMANETGRKTYYIYDEDGKNLLKIAQPLNGTDAYNPSDESGFAITDYDYFTNEYTIKGLIKTLTDPEQGVTKYTYNDGNVESVTSSESTIENQIVTNYTYNSMGMKTKEISPEGFETDYVYDEAGNLEKVIQDRGETTRISYDDVGRKIKEVSPKLYEPSLDNMSSHEYNGDSGYRYIYYNDNRLQEVIDPENNITEYTYDPAGNIETKTTPNLSIYTYEYDALNRLTKVYFSEFSGQQKVLLEENEYLILTGGKTQKINRVYLSDSQTAVTFFTYDYAGRLLETKLPDNTTRNEVLNADGTVNNKKDGNGKTTYFKYDGLNRINEMWIPVEANGSSTIYQYTKFEYDRSGRKTVEKIGKEKVLQNSYPTNYIIKEYDYYKDGSIKEEKLNGQLLKKYEYDRDGNLNKEIVYTGMSDPNITEYTNNHLGKPEVIMVHIRAGDLFGNNFDNTGDEIITTTCTYDRNGNLETITTPEDITTTYTYDNLNRQTGMSRPGTDEYGNAVTVETGSTYNWEGKTLTSTDAEDNTTTYAYNQRGFLETVTDSELGVTAYYYDRSGRKIAEVSPENYNAASALSEMNRTEYTYDKMGRVKTKRDIYLDPDTSQWTTIVTKSYKYDANGNLTKELDAIGFEVGTGSTDDQKIDSGYGTVYTYNLANQVSTVTDPVSGQRGLPFATQYTYDSIGRKLTEKNAANVITKYYYDDAGNVTQVTVRKTANDPEQIINLASYDFIGNVLTQTDGNGNTTSFEYNVFDELRKAIHPGDSTIPQNTVIYQYDEMGNLKKQQNSLDAVDEFIYDNLGRQTSHTQKKSDGTESITTSTSYDLNGNQRFVIDGNGTETENIYDGLNRLESSTITVSGVEQTTVYEYDKNGNQILVTDWRGNTYRSIYDPLNRLIEKKDPYQKTIERLEYNHNSAQVKSYDALDHLTQYTYDRNNRLLSTLDALNHATSQTYDNVGNIETKTDGRNNVTRYTYDEFNRLKTVKNAKNEITSYTYDLSDNMLTQTNGRDFVTTCEYNAANKVKRKYDNGGDGITAKTETYTYYADGSLAGKTDRNGEITEYTYDVHGRLVDQVVGNILISYTYDGNSNQLTMTDGTGTTVRTYDELNRVLTKQVPYIGTSTYVYDIIEGMEEGCIKESSTDPKGNVTAKVTDRAGRLWKVTADSKTTTYSYYDNGSMQNVVYDDGSREEYTYYDDNLLWTLTNKRADGSVMDTYTYTYDAAHNQNSKHEVINGITKGTTNFTYDELNRLFTVAEPGGKSTSYTYDASGNRKTETITAGSTTTINTYSYNDQDRLTGIITTVNGTVTDTTVYGYDNNGNMLTTTVDSNMTVTNTYDELNQLIQTDAGTTTVINTYNGDGLRISKSVDGTLTRYLYEYDKVVLETNGSNVQTARNVYGTNLLMRDADGESYYYMYNGHADVTALLETDGAIAGTYYYDAFGNMLEHTGNVNNSINYAGYQYDKETGLYYLNSRMYDPKIARFMQEDTYTGDPSNPLSLNLYTYSANNPLIYYDPTGHSFTDVKNWFNKNVLDPTGDWISKKADEYIVKPIEQKVNQVIGTVNTVSDFASNVYDIFKDDEKLGMLSNDIGKKFKQFGVDSSLYFGQLGYSLDHPDEAWVLKDDLVKPFKDIYNSANYMLTTPGYQIVNDVGNSISNYVTKFNQSDVSVRSDMLAGTIYDQTWNLAIAGLTSGIGFETSAARVVGSLGKKTGGFITGDATSFAIGGVDDVAAMYGGLPKRSLVPNSIKSGVSKSGRIPVPGDVDFVGSLPGGSWKLSPRGQGAHLVEKVNVEGRTNLSQFNTPGTPRYYPNGTSESAGQAHIRLHKATKEAGIDLQGGNLGMMDADLINTYKNAYSNPSLEGILGDLRTPNSKVVVGRNLTPTQALEELLKWGNKR